MLDIQLLRKNPEGVKTALARRSPAHIEQIDLILASDTKRREAETKLQTLQANRNRLSKEIGMMKSRKEDSSSLEAEVKNLATEMEELRATAEELEVKQRDLLLRLPNMPHAVIPDGHDASHNKTIRSWGTPLQEKRETHIEIGERLGLFDLDRATKLSGSGYVCFTGKGARLERALINFLLDLQTEQHGYTEMGMPVLVRRDCMIGTGQLPKFEDDLFKIEGEDLYLIPTAEVSLTNLYNDEILDKNELPLLLTSYTPCFRKEAGSAGRDTRGLIRQHQFDKVEMVAITSQEQSDEIFLKMVNCASDLLTSLGLCHQKVQLCTGDLGFGAAVTIDLEVWLPGQNRFREISSISNTRDFQARRAKIRYKDDKKNIFAHTLNGSSLAVGRTLLAIMENYQEANGTIKIPEVLKPYLK